MYAVIAENDESKWDDRTGIQYHFPARYLKFLQPGTQIIYYKGRLRDKNFAKLRLTNDPHYFAIGTIGKLTQAEKSENWYASITNYQLFPIAVPFKINKTTLEKIPANRKTNYFRDGVRSINKTTYNLIVKLAALDLFHKIYDDQGKDEFQSDARTEGGETKRFVTVYERDKKLRDQAISFHGYTCACCNFNFKDFYGIRGEGYIHVHHIIPMSTVKVKRVVDPITDLCVVCANCHSMIHRNNKHVLTLEELIEMIQSPKKLRRS